MAKAQHIVRKRKTSKAVLDNDPYYSRAVGKALLALEFLRTAEAASLNDIAKRLQLSKTSTFRLVRTLQVTDYVTVNGQGQYQLAHGYHLLAQIQWLGRLLRFGIPCMQALSSDLGETVSLAALFENRSEVVAVVESTQTIRMSNVVGHILPPNASSLGKVITAFQTQERREKLIRSFGIWKLTGNTIHDQAKLRQEFDLVRERQFAADREESVYEGICFGVPIFAADQEVAAAISASFPKTRVRDADHEREIVAQLRAAAARISADLRSFS
jgi:DNA-binding IclR family transcriptional regulator